MSRVSRENRRMAGEARRAYRNIRSSAATLQAAIFAETLRDAPILPARFVEAPRRCARIAFGTSPAGSSKIGGVAAVPVIEYGP